MSTITRTGYRLSLADSDDELAAVARLRYQVFGEELGARLAAAPPGHDVDSFDAYCDHLMVIDEATDQVIGVYRLLPPGRSPSRYGDGEFDLSALDPIADQLVEAGRACVHPAHRNGAVINLIWAGIARYLHLHGHRYLGGCASVGLQDGDADALTVQRLADTKHRAPAHFAVSPWRPWRPGPGPVNAGQVPPLLRGYLRLGAWICGEPGYDPDFECADFYVLLDTAQIDSRYLRHFLGIGGLQTAAGTASGGLAAGSGA